MSNCIETNIETKNLLKYHIAYFDILGYKKYFNDEKQVNEFFNTICECFQEFFNIAKDINPSENTIPEKNHLKIKIYSDNFLVCISPFFGINEKTFIGFIGFIAYLQNLLIIKYKILVRGGITLGDLYIDDDFVFGDGLIKAVELEHKKAKTPRIIIDPDLFFRVTESDVTSNEKSEELGIIEFFKNRATNDEAEKHIIDNIIKKEEKDNFLYISYLCDLFYPKSKFANSQHNNLELLDSYYAEHRRVIIKLIRENCYKKDFDSQKNINHDSLKEHQKNILKYLWLIDYYNDFYKDYNSDYLIKFDRVTLSLYFHDVTYTIGINIINEEI